MSNQSFYLNFLLISVLAICGQAFAQDMDPFNSSTKPQTSFLFFNEKDLLDLELHSNVEVVEELLLRPPGNCTFSDKSLKAITKFTNLRSLEFFYVKASASTIEHIVNSLPELKSLDISGPFDGNRITFNNLHPNKYLEELDLYNLTLSKEQLRIFGKLSSLRKLQYSLIDFPDSEIPSCSDLKNLRELYITNCYPDKSMFSAFKETSKIKILSFIGTAIDGKSLDCFSHNPVEALDLENTKFSDADFQTLAKFKSLRDLDLELNNITGSKFQVLAQLPKLAELDISKCPLSFNGYINLVLYGRQIKKIYLTSQFAKNSDNPIDVLALKLLMPGTQIYFEKPGIEYTPGDIELIY